MWWLFGLINVIIVMGFAWFYHKKIKEEVVWLREEKVAVVPGNAFGESGEGFIRCSYAYSIDSIKEALTRIKRFVENHS